MNIIGYYIVVSQTLPEAVYSALHLVRRYVASSKMLHPSAHLSLSL